MYIFAYIFMSKSKSYITKYTLVKTIYKYILLLEMQLPFETRFRVGKYSINAQTTTAKQTETHTRTSAIINSISSAIRRCTPFGLLLQLLQQSLLFLLHLLLFWKGGKAVKRPLETLTFISWRIQVYSCTFVIVAVNAVADAVVIIIAFAFALLFLRFLHVIVALFAFLQRCFIFSGLSVLTYIRVCLCVCNVNFLLTSQTG